MSGLLAADSLSFRSGNRNVRGGKYLISLSILRSLIEIYLKRIAFSLIVNGSSL